METERKLHNPRSMNGRLIVEAYSKEGLKATISNGFAMIEQKVSVKGLTVLLDAKLADGTIVEKGSTAYIREESLHTAPWATKRYASPFISGEFMIVDITNVEFIVPPLEPVA